MYVYVAAKNGKPLMPTKRIGHVWDLLQAGKAKLISDAPQYPVIQLQYDTEILTQPLYGGTHVRGFTKKDDGNPGSFDTAVLDAKGNVIYTDHCVFHEYAGKLGKKYVTCLEVSSTHKKKLLPRPRRIHHRTIPITARYSCNEQEEPASIAELHNPAYMKRLVCSFDLKSTRAYVAHIHSLQHILPITDWTLDYNPYLAASISSSARQKRWQSSRSGSASRQTTRASRCARRQHAGRRRCRSSMHRISCRSGRNGRGGSGSAEESDENYIRKVD